MGKKKGSKKRCPHCNKLYSASYINAHIRKVHGRVPPKKGPHRGKVKGRGNYYVQRDSKGRFKEWTRVMPEGIRADKAKKAKTRPKKPGKGHRGDYPKRRKKGVK